MKELKDFEIAFSGLKLGEHTFQLTAGDRFFENYSVLEVKSGQVHIALTLTKKERMLVWHFQIKGVLQFICDRCLQLMDYPISLDEMLYVKLLSGIDTPSEESEDVIDIPETDSAFNVGHYLYEFISVALPMKRVHGEDENGNSLCDVHMLELLEEKGQQPEVVSETDPRWDALKELKNKLDKSKNK